MNCKSMRPEALVVVDYGGSFDAVGKVHASLRRSCFAWTIVCLAGTRCAAGELVANPVSLCHLILVSRHLHFLLAQEFHRRQMAIHRYPRCLGVSRACSFQEFE